MKLFVLKLISLLVMLAGIVGLGHRLGYMPSAQEDQTPGAACCATIKAALPDIHGINLLTWSAYGGAILLGFYGFIPRIPSRGKSIVFPGQYGPISIALKPVENSLHRVLRRMPEIAKFQAKVAPAENGKKVRIDAAVVLQTQPAARARKTVELVHEYIAQTAARMLGLEDISTITLKVEHINVDAKRASKMLHDEIIERVAQAEEEEELHAMAQQAVPMAAAVPVAAGVAAAASVSEAVREEENGPGCAGAAAEEIARTALASPAAEEAAWNLAEDSEAETLAPESLPEALPEAEPLEEVGLQDTPEGLLPPLADETGPEETPEEKKTDDPWSLR